MNLETLNFIKIRKGEPTNFAGKTIRIDLSDIKLDLTGFTANFKLGSINLSFSNFETTKYLDLNFVVPESFSVGMMYGYLRFTDPNDKNHTIDCQIPFKVLEKVF